MPALGTTVEELRRVPFLPRARRNITEMYAQTLAGKAGRRPRKTVVFVSGTLVLVATWCLLALFAWGMTEVWLVPWDCVHTSLRPPVGTWQRTVNDFFEGPPGSILPAAVLVVVSASIFAVGTVRSTNGTLLPWAFGGANLVFLLAVLFSLQVVYLLPIVPLAEPRPPIDVGYHRTWPAILTTTVLVAALFLVQCRIAIGRRSRAS